MQALEPVAELLGELPARTGCPKHMVFGPCGGVRADSRCEMAQRPCPFVAEAAPAWPVADAHPATTPSRLTAARRPLVLTDFSVTPYDAAEIAAVARVLAGAADAVLVGEHHNRPDYPPTVLVPMLRDAGVEAVVTLTCRDRNRLVLEQELAGLAFVGAAGVLAVTGDGRAHGVRPGVTQVFDLDGPRLASLARSAGLTTLVAESPQSAPMSQRPQRVLTKQRAGAQLCVLNHVSDVRVLATFIDECRTVGVSIPFIAGVAAFVDEQSARVLQRFPGLHLSDAAVDRVLRSADPERAGIDAAVAEARALLAVPGVAGVNISGLASAGGPLPAARVKAEIGRRLREGDDSG